MVRMRWRRLSVLVLLACSSPPEREPEPAGPREVAWNGGLPSSASIEVPRGFVARRSVFHLHSPFSHDACDSRGYEDGQVDQACLLDLRQALCTTRFDLAWLTDHPDHGSEQSFEGLFHEQPGDRWAAPGVLEITCDDGHVVRWRAGFEDELMPVGLKRHVHADQATRHDLLNRSDAEALRAMNDAGAMVLMAHTEGKDLERLERLQDEGMHGVEAFNLHAMFGPDIRQEHLGLDPLGWLEDLGPFLSDDSTMEPDLLFLAVHGPQPPSLQRWDALLQRGPMMGTAGTDAHQNVMPAEMSDGDRLDSYRRMLRWISTTVLARGDSVEDDLEAVAARRAYISFEALGTPTGVDLHVESGGAVFEMGSDAPAGDVVVSCPRVHADSPWMGSEPEIAVRVIKDGQPWQSGCGRWPLERGVVRVEVDITPHHIAGFLGEETDRFVRPYPWVYTGAVRVGM